MAIADAFVDSARSATSEAELFNLLFHCCEAIGIRYFALVHHVDFGLDTAPAIRLHNYPETWQHWFDENRLGRSDPIHRASQLTCAGFAWSAVPSMITLTPMDRSVLAQARIVGIGDGYTVPANVPGEFTGSCSFAMDPGIPFPRHLHSAAQVLAGNAFDAARRLANIRRIWPAPDRPITDRQRACLLWSARGKTDWETSQILGISKGTVIQHLKHARERYDVHKTGELSIRALHDGMIAFSEVGGRR
ncbi:MAG: LuxR family transcriptional regulator [Sphingomonas sp.]|jgi:LuxR family quorum-sensing system transcriptional regulator CciR|uniref:LuxR family transcriptional regulator n=1 Tax=Sphingomonas sp. TaxID=28214 RepID=UPI00356883A9